MRNRLPSKRRLRTVAGKRKSVLPYQSWLRRSLSKMLSQGHHLEAAGLLSEEVLGTDLYLEFLRISHADGLVRRRISDFEMLLDADDSGLSERLIRYGVHEQTSSLAYRNELARLRDEVDGELGVLELGANMGYFLLTAASVFGERANVYAVEPHAENMKLLRRNVRLNGLMDRVEFIEGGVGGESRPAQFHVMPQSNWHTVGGPDADYSHAVSTTEIDLKTVDDLLDEHGLAPSDVHAVRFDIEDYEPRVFDGMKRLLDADTPLVLYVEFHFAEFDDETVREMLETLDRSGLEVASAVRYDLIDWDGTPVEADRFEDLWQYRSENGLEVVARR